MIDYGMIDYGRLARDVAANRQVLDKCPRHLFLRPAEGWRLGQKVICSNCGGAVSNTEMGSYIKGYAAAGADPKDVCPDWKQPD